LGSNPAITKRRARPIWLWKHSFGVRLAVCFLFILAATLLADLTRTTTSHANLVWVSSGLPLAYLLMTPRWRWPRYLIVSFTAIVLSSFLVHERWWINLSFNTLGILKVGVIAHLMRRKSTQLPQFTDKAYIRRFLGIGLLAVPVGTAITGVSLFYSVTHFADWSSFLRFLASDILGLAVVTPAATALLRWRFRGPVNFSGNFGYIALLIVVTFVACTQNGIPLVSYIFPILLLVMLRMGLGAAMLGTLFVTAVAASSTVRGVGPFAFLASAMQNNEGFRLQSFLGAIVLMLYSASVVVENLRDTQKQLQKTAALHKLVTENSRDIIVIADFEGNRAYVSAAGAMWGGWTREELVKHGGVNLVHPDDFPKAMTLLGKMRAGFDGDILECRVRQRNGDYIWVEASLRTIRDPVTGAPSGILNMVRDISERKSGEQARAFHLSLLKAIQDASLDGILVVNNERRVVSYNKQFLDIWQVSLPGIQPGPAKEQITYTETEFFSKSVGMIKDPEGFAKRVQELFDHPEADDRNQFELRDGRTLEWYSTGLKGEGSKYLGRAWFTRDITKRQRAQEELQEAYRALTGIANRRRFHDCLSAEWRRGLREQKPLSILMIDVDLFKLYNDTYGHLRGDSCLKQVAESAMDVITRPGDVVARFGGEEFAVILPNTTQDGAMRIANEIGGALRQRRLEHGRSPHKIVTISAGCATMVPQFGARPADLIETADNALYRAKRRGRNLVCGNESFRPRVTNINK
jgi:diguanylate cyclase (GGDEF)-like protein/PAS domain S-box-containing protein